MHSHHSFQLNEYKAIMEKSSDKQSHNDVIKNKLSNLKQSPTLQGLIWVSNRNTCSLERAAALIQCGQQKRVCHMIIALM